jgi:hypothetical protein
VLDHLARPHGIKARVLQRPGSIGRHLSQVEFGMTLAGTPQRLDGDVNPHRAGPYMHKRGRKAPLAAAHIQDSCARGNMCEQEGAPQPLLSWVQPLWHSLP